MPYTTVVAGTTITAAWGNANVRDQVVTPFASASARTSAITSPVTGMVSTLTDALVADLYDGSAWVPVGPVCTDAVTVTASAPFVSATAFGTEAEVSTKMRLTLPQVRNGELWVFVGQYLYSTSATGSDWTYRLREDSSSGTQIGAGYLANVGGGLIQQFAFVMPWACGADATSKVICSTLTRNGGTSTVSIYNIAGGTQSLFVAGLRVGRSTKFRSVA